mgnify:CR=1 FL=1
MEISLLLMQQIAQLFLILIMGYAVVKVGLLKASDSRVLSVVMVYLVTPCVIINAFQDRRYAGDPLRDFCTPWLLRRLSM